MDSPYPDNIPPNLGNRIIINESQIDPIDLQCNCKELSDREYININRDCKRKDEDCDPLWKKRKRS